MRDKIEEVLNIHKTLPILFIGSGISRRYLGLENWEGLLRYLARRISDNEFAFEMYNSMAETSEIQIGLYQKIAELIGNDFTKVWFTDDKFKDIREAYKNDVKNKVAPIKIEIADYIKNNSSKFLEIHKKEIELFKKVGKRSIAGIITTNYDLLLENTLSGYKRYIGQEELIFSQLQGIGEIYKIHGCCTDPFSIVINEADYRYFEEKNTYLASKILTLFLEHPVIFVGYSLEDENIKNILKSITNCLSKENLEKLKKRLIFIEWTTDDIVEISTHAIDFGNGKKIEMTKIKLNNFEVLYEAMLENKSKYSAPILRRLKQDIYEMVATNEPTVKAKIIGIDDDVDLEKIEYVMGVGVIADFGNKGYMGLTAEDIFLDVIFDDRSFDSNLIVSQSLPTLLSHNSNSIPIYKYLSKSTLAIPDKVLKEIKNNFDDLLSRTILSKKKKSNLDEYTIEMLKAEFGVEKSLEMIAMLPEENIDLNQLELFLKEYYEDNRDIFKSGNSNLKTNYRRLIKIYDWLKYYKKKES